MGLDINLFGMFVGARNAARVPKAAEKLITKWCNDEFARPASFKEGGATVLVADLHPAAERVNITFDRTGGVRLAARTNTAGPGYHEYVCGLARLLERELGITWAPEAGLGGEGSSDDTGYFFKPDRAELEERMCSWIAAACDAVLEHSERNAGISLGMPLDAGFEHPAPIRTPMGPRTFEWARAVVADPRGPEARSFFAWWDAPKDARFHLNLALSLMWTDVAPARPETEEQARTQARVLNALDAAYEMDAGLSYPWADWLDLVNNFPGDASQEAADLIAMLKSRAAGAPPSIGYRRYPVRHVLPGGWSIRTPGEFSIGMEDDETWLASNGVTHVRFGSMFFGGEEGPPAEEILAPVDGQTAGEPLAPLDTEGVRGVAYLKNCEEEGERYQIITGHAATQGNVALVTVTFDRPEDRGAAEEIWRSIRGPLPEA